MKFEANKEFIGNLSLQGGGGSVLKDVNSIINKFFRLLQLFGFFCTENIIRKTMVKY